MGEFKCDTKKAYENQVRHEELLEKRRIGAFCLGLKAELEAVWKKYEETGGNALLETREDQFFSGYYTLTGNYFDVYSNNTSLIGHIEDEELRQRIIRVYTDFKGLVDSYKTNNDLLERLEEFRAGLRNDLGYENSLRDYAKKLKAGHASLKTDVTRVTGLLGEYAQD